MVKNKHSMNLWNGVNHSLEKSIKFYEEGGVTISETNNNLEFGVVITVIAFALVGYYFWRNRK